MTTQDNISPNAIILELKSVQLSPQPPYFGQPFVGDDLSLRMLFVVSKENKP
ncbi:MAG: hypothetical protein AAFR31_12380 [Cyanobacteria bacterium J06627_8]